MTVSQPAPRKALLPAWLACVAALAAAGCMTNSGSSGAASAAESSAVAAALQVALEENVSGMAQAWHDPATGARGSILPMRTFRTASGLVCRDYTLIVIEGGATRSDDGTACRDSDGRWKDAG